MEAIVQRKSVLRSPETFSNGIPGKAIREYHRDNLAWLRCVDPDDLDAASPRVSGVRSKLIAPVHGHPIGPPEHETYHDRLIKTVDRIADDYTIT